MEDRASYQTILGLAVPWDLVRVELRVSPRGSTRFDRPLKDNPDRSIRRLLSWLAPANPDHSEHSVRPRS